VIPETKAAGGVLTAKQAPHRPGTAPALGLRAGCVVAPIIEQTNLAKEIPMWFRTLFDSMKLRRSGTPVRPTPRRTAAARLRVEALEDRCMPSFLAPVYYDGGGNPMVAADFNNDTVQDLAGVNYNSVSVVLGNADGTFQPAQDFATGAGAFSLAVGDFNADGKLDLATADTYGVSVLLGKGNGTFQPPVSTTNGLSPESFAVADFNADGKLDLGVTWNIYVDDGCDEYGQCYDHYQGYASVLLGNGAGSFSAPNTTSLGSGFHTSAAVADFNGDGKQDFASANNTYNSYNTLIFSRVSVLLGTGTGSLAALNDFGTGYYPVSVAAGDVNGDGKADLVTANENDLSVLLGTGTGSFGAAQSYTAGSQPKGVAMADFNGDGHIDLITFNGDRGTVSVLLGTGAGAFRPPVSADGAGPMGAVADFNGDGRMDWASARWLLLNDGIWPALDAPLITIDDVAVTEGNIGTVSAVFSVRLSAAYGQTVSVPYATRDGSATAGSDYQAASGTLTFAPGETSKNVTVLVNGDRLYEGYESFDVYLSEPTNAFAADAIGVGIILDDEPYVSINDSFSGLEGNTGTTPLTFTVTLSAVYDAPVTVDYATADLTSWYGLSAATAGVDYTAASGTLTIPAGQPSGTITVLVTGDRLGEPDEPFFVILSNPTSAGLSYFQALTTIVDDEPRVSIGGATGVEGNTGTTPFTFTVSLAAAYDVPVTVSFATADGSGSATIAGGDYQAASGTVIFAAGQTSQNITVLVNGDRLGEPNEYFSVNLSNLNYGAIANSQGRGTILDDEPYIRINNVRMNEGNSGTAPAVFAVTLSAAYDVPVTVNFATYNGSATAGSDYQAASGTLTIAAGQTSGTINVLVNGDRLGEPNEAFFVYLSNPTNASIGNFQGMGTIVDDEPHISISDVTKAEGKRGHTTLFTFTVTLSAAYDQAVTMSFRTVDGTATTSDSDYVAKTGTLTFAPGETTKTITIEVKGDNKKEADETFYLDLFGNSSNSLFTKSRGLGTILNDH
jgi:hypothetical protein